MDYNRTYYFVYDDSRGSKFHMTKLEEVLHATYDRKPESKVSWDSANLVGSMTEQDPTMHLPMFDCDGGLSAALAIEYAFGLDSCKIVQSRTPRHYHVYVELPFTWSVCQMFLNYFELLDVIDINWARACKRQGQMYLRKSTVR